MKPDIGSESQFLPTSPAFDAPVRGWGAASDYCHAVWYAKTRMVWLPDGKIKLKMGLFVMTESTNKTDGQTDTQTPHDG